MMIKASIIKGKGTIFRLIGGPRNIGHPWGTSLARAYQSLMSGIAWSSKHNRSDPELSGVSYPNEIRDRHSNQG